MASTRNVIKDFTHNVRHSTPQEGNEGKMTRLIEQRTSRVPSMAFLGLAMGSMAVSGAIQYFGQRKDLAQFIGLWAPTLLIVGVYNKLVKLEDKRTNA